MPRWSMRRCFSVHVNNYGAFCCGPKLLSSSTWQVPSVLRPVLRLYPDTRAALPPLAGAVKSHFPVFLHCERRKAGSCSFTAALIGGKLDFLAFLRSERRKTGNCSFTAAPIGGKVDFSVFLHSERRKLEIAFMLRAHAAEIL
ncbi:hypothetical protein AAC387_Pa08g0704 [Persea americana]